MTDQLSGADTKSSVGFWQVDEQLDGGAVGPQEAFAPAYPIYTAEATPVSLPKLASGDLVGTNQVQVEQGPARRIER